MRSCFNVLFGLLVVLLVSPRVSAFEEDLSSAHINGIQMAYMDLGDGGSPAAILIMGLGSSHRVWGHEIVDGLLEAGYRVVIFDNRDTGGTQRFDEHGRLLWWELLKDQLGFDVNEVYTLRDLAADTAALMDHLEINSGHIVGVSMGGMIAQIFAAEWPERTDSLTSIMSSPGFRDDLPEPTDEALELLDSTVPSESELKELHATGIYPLSVERQLLAILDAGDRSEAVSTIEVPSLVIHGMDDGLFPVEHGKATAALIQNSRLVTYQDMGHDIPDAVLPLLIEELIKHFQSAGHIEPEAEL
ncbi:MAG: alpha/beta hydrolase [Halioglobus sp.]